MIDPKNFVGLTCGIVQDPEIVNDSILKLRVAADYSGSERGSDNKSGYFDVTYFLNNDEAGRNATFIRNQIAEGKLKKGSQIQLVGRLNQDRWATDDGSKRSAVGIVAESITYAGGARPQTAEGGQAAPRQATAAANIDEF